MVSDVVQERGAVGIERLCQLLISITRRAFRQSTETQLRDKIKLRLSRKLPNIPHSLRQ